MHTRKNQCHEVSQICKNLFFFFFAKTLCNCQSIVCTALPLYGLHFLVPGCVSTNSADCVLFVCFVFIYIWKKKNQLFDPDVINTKLEAVSYKCNTAPWSSPMSGAPASHCDFWLPFSLELSGRLAASEAMKRRGRYGPVRGGAEQQDVTPWPVFTENIYIAAAHDYGGHRRNCAMRRMFTRHSGGREGGGENFFVCEYLYTVKGLIKRNGEVVCLSLTQHGGRELRRGLQLWFYSAKKM